MLLLVYNYCILSSLSYGILVCGYNTDWLFKLQTRADNLDKFSRENLMHTQTLITKTYKF